MAGILLYLLVTGQHLDASNGVFILFGVACAALDILDNRRRRRCTSC